MLCSHWVAKLFPIPTPFWAFGAPIETELAAGEMELIIPETAPTSFLAESTTTDDETCHVKNNTSIGFKSVASYSLQNTVQCFMFSS